MTNDELAAWEKRAHEAIATDDWVAAGAVFDALISEVKRLRGIITEAKFCDQCGWRLAEDESCRNPSCKMGTYWPRQFTCPQCHQDVMEWSDRETGHAAGCKGRDR